jgi:hypothetical protein
LWVIERLTVRHYTYRSLGDVDEGLMTFVSSWEAAMSKPVSNRGVTDIIHDMEDDVHTVCAYADLVILAGGGLIRTKLGNRDGEVVQRLGHCLVDVTERLRHSWNELIKTNHKAEKEKADAPAS